jgi:hypothetical protein
MKSEHTMQSCRYGADYFKKLRFYKHSMKVCAKYKETIGADYNVLGCTLINWQYFRQTCSSFWLYHSPEKRWSHARGREAHCCENPIYLFPEKELCGLSPNFHIHMSKSDLHIPRICPHIFFLSKIGDRLWKYINRSQIHECGRKLGRAISFLGIFDSNVRIVSLQCRRN